MGCGKDSVDILMVDGLDKEQVGIKVKECAIDVWVGNINDVKRWLFVGTLRGMPPAGIQKS